MKRPARIVLISLSLLLASCTPAATLAPSVPTPASLPPDTPTEYVPTALPVTPTYEGCAYVWGSKDLPDLSRRLNAEVQKISTDASILAYAYGENCVYADGHSDFHAMETDFRVGVKVKTVRDEDALGNWIDRVMKIIVAVPRDELSGPQPGRVDFDFKQPDPAEIIVHVPIDMYLKEADDLRGAALFRLFYKP